MKLSVVIPAHNEAESIGETVACTVNELERAPEAQKPASRSWSTKDPSWMEKRNA